MYLGTHCNMSTKSVSHPRTRQVTQLFTYLLALKSSVYILTVKSLENRPNSLSTLFITKFLVIMYFVIGFLLRYMLHPRYPCVSRKPVLYRYGRMHQAGFWHSRPRRMLPPGESRWVCRRNKQTNRRKDGRTPDRYITLSARRDQHNDVISLVFDISCGSADWHTATVAIIATEATTKLLLAAR